VANDADQQEDLRMYVMDLQSAVVNVSTTLESCAQKLQPTDWNVTAAKREADSALAVIETASLGQLEHHVNMLREILTSARTALEHYKAQTDQMAGRGGMTGIFVRSAMNGVDRVLNTKQ
jgi:hypothetical protein